MDLNSDDQIDIPVMLKPLKWFEKYAYKDADGDFWRSEEDYKYWDTNNNNFMSLAIMPSTLNGEIYWYSSYTNTIKIDWAIDYICTKHTTPEIYV